MVMQPHNPIGRKLDSMAASGSVFPPRRVGDANVGHVELPAQADTGNTGLEKPRLRGTEGDDDVGTDVKGSGVLNVCDFACSKRKKISMTLMTRGNIKAR